MSVLPCVHKNLMSWDARPVTAGSRHCSSVGKPTLYHQIFFGFQNVGCSHCMVSYLQHAVSAASEAEGVSAGAGGLSGGPKADQAV